MKIKSIIIFLFVAPAYVFAKAQQNQWPVFKVLSGSLTLERLSLKDVGTQKVRSRTISTGETITIKIK